ncbi:hypothetical protein ES703_94323 [subsurface metagenome]
MLESFQRVLKIDAGTQEKATLVIDGYKNRFALKGLSGRYETIQDFEETLNHHINEDARKGNSLHFFLTFTLQEFRELTETLNEALAASEEAR